MRNIGNCGVDGWLACTAATGVPRVIPEAPGLPSVIPADTPTDGVAATTDVAPVDATLTV